MFKYLRNPSNTFEILHVKYWKLGLTSTKLKIANIRSIAVKNFTFLMIGDTEQEIEVSSDGQVRYDDLHSMNDNFLSVIKIPVEEFDECVNVTSSLEF